MRQLTAQLIVATGGIGTLVVFPYLCYLLLYARLNPESVPANKKYIEPTVSVVLPTYNEAEIIEAKLQDIVKLDYPMEKIEVVLADASSDDTVAIVRDFFEDLDAPDLTVHHDQERRGVAIAVNQAVAIASGDVIFRTDADSKLGNTVLREAVATLSDPTVGVVTGQQTEVLGGSTVESDYRNLLTIVQTVESWLDSTFIVHGPCVAFRRNEYVPVADDVIADDTAIALAIRRTGKRVVMNPAMEFVEAGVSSFVTRRTRKDRRAKGLIQMLVRNRDMLGRYNVYGWVVLPINWWFMIVSPWLMALSVCLATVVAVLVTGSLGLLFPTIIAVYVWLGQRDALGKLGIPYAVLDSQVSLWLASIDVLTNSEDDGTWTVDRQSRRFFK